VKEQLNCRTNEWRFVLYSGEGAKWARSNAIWGHPRVFET
jgi:hypothetical protein